MVPRAFDMTNFWDGDNSRKFEGKNPVINNVFNKESI